MNVRNCRKCGKIFNYIVGPALCASCKDEAEKVYQEVKKFVQEHRGVSIPEVADACNVEPQQIRQWIREERLEFSEDSMIGIGCELCGATIRTGRYCEACKAKTAQGLRNAISRPAPSPVQKKPVNPKDNPKMRFLQ